MPTIFFAHFSGVYFFIVSFAASVIFLLFLNNAFSILAKKDKAIEGIFEDGVNAYIYEDFYQWAERIEKALFKNNKKIIDKAKETMKQFTPDKWAKKIANIYIELNPKK